MIKEAKAGKPIDMDAVPPPVAIGSTKPSAPAPSLPTLTEASPAVENLDSHNKATKLDQNAVPTPSQGGMFKHLSLFRQVTDTKFSCGFVGGKLCLYIL